MVYKSSFADEEQGGLYRHKKRCLCERQMKAPIMTIKIADRKIFCYLRAALLGNISLYLRSAIIDEIANFKTIDNGTSTCYMVGCLSVSIWAFGDNIHKSL